MSGDLTWVVIDDAATLTAIEPEWWDLWRRASAATPFQSPAWLLAWWEAFAPGELLVLSARHSGRLVGLAPFYIEHGRRVLPIGISVSDYQDILADDDHADAVRHGLAVWIGDRWHCWTCWELVELPPGAHGLRMTAPDFFSESVERASACPVLVLPPDGGDLAGVLPARKRRAVRLARNRAARHGSVDLVEAGDPDAAIIMLERLFDLHGARWRQRGEAGVLADSRVYQFHRAVLPRLLDAGLLRLCELRIAGAAAAVYYGFHHRDIAYGYLTGFDPGFEFESPGVIVLAHAMERAIREGAREFHFLRGREPYKYGWGAEDRWNMRRLLWAAAAHARAS